MTDQASLLLRKQLKGEREKESQERAAPPASDTRKTRAPAVHSRRRSLTPPRPCAPFPSFPCTELTKKPVEGFSAGLVNDSLFEWQVTIMGPPDTY